MRPHQAWFRFYAELNDFLPRERRGGDALYAFDGTPSVKDAIESQGVPHVEVDLILVDGVSVGFGHPLRDGARVSVYPVFETLDVAELVRLRPAPLRVPRFACDVHLGKLARRLRLLGFDTLYRNDWDDADLAAVCAAERRCLLTRDIGLLKRNEVDRGYWLRATDPGLQIREVIGRLDLRRAARPFTRCLVCNGELGPVAKEEILGELPPRTRRDFEEFRSCAGCGRNYWCGSHFDRLARVVEHLLAGS
jgi:uncharacterized protein with PIN domain